MITRRVPLRRVVPERLKHESGEALLGRDFADQAAQDDQLRWWHTRALHGAWGIAEGLNVSGVKPGGIAKLSAGVAFDLFGRELVLDEIQRVSVPETADEFVLVISYDRSSVDCEPPSGPCVSSFVPASGVRLDWILRRSFSPASGVPLAILNEDDTCPPPFARPYVRPQARPTIGHSVVTMSNHDFVKLIETVNGEPKTIGFELTIDTKAAGFTRVPHYFAELSIPVSDAPPEVIFFVNRHHLAVPRRDRFSVRFIASESDQFGALELLQSNATLPIRISWIGIEPRPRPTFFSRANLLLEGEVNDEFHP